MARLREPAAGAVVDVAVGGRVGRIALQLVTGRDDRRGHAAILIETLKYHCGLRTRSRMNKPAELKFEMVPFWINGKPVAPAPRHGEVFNPATGHVVRHVAFADAGIVDAAVKAASAAFPEWRDTPPLRPARVMQKFLPLLQRDQKTLARILTQEHGKTLPDAIGSVH